MMIFDVREHGGGKTLAMIYRLVNRDIDAIVFPTMEQVRNAQALARRVVDHRIVVRPEQFICVADVASGRVSLGPEVRVGVDEVDGVLNALLGAEVIVVSGTMDAATNARLHA